MDPLRFVTIDTWSSVKDYEAFRASYASEYAALDRASILDLIFGD